MKRFLTIAFIVLGLFIPGSRMVNAGQAHESPTVSYVVKPGDNLWKISGQHAPDADRRETVSRLIELNQLGRAGLIPGQSIRVPAP